jgi:hypothetical protein
MRLSDLHRRILAGEKFDPDALTYINAVENADMQSLEFGVKKAINDFVKGCKSDGIWNSIKASCILAGARTRVGALVPLKGTAPTSVNFIDSDYNRKTGLIGNKTDKYINSNRNNNSDPQNSHHLVVSLSQNNGVDGAGEVLIGAGAVESGSSQIGLSINSPQVFVRSRCANGFFNLTGGNSTGVFGINRSSSSEYILRIDGNNININENSQTAVNSSIFVFARNNNRLGGISPSAYTDARINFYSIGESIDLALLDARVTTLINTYNAVI